MFPDMVKFLFSRLHCCRFTDQYGQPQFLMTSDVKYADLVDGVLLTMNGVSWYGVDARFEDTVYGNLAPPPESTCDGAFSRQL